MYTYRSVELKWPVYSNSRNDVPRVAQRYGTTAAHTQRRASVLVVFVVFCVHLYKVADLIRRTPPPTFSDTAITDRRSDTTIFQLRAHWVRISWSIGSEKSFGHVPPVVVEPSTSSSTLSTRPGSPLKWQCFVYIFNVNSTCTIFTVQFMQLFHIWWS